MRWIVFPSMHLCAQGFHAANPESDAIIAKKTSLSAPFLSIGAPNLRLTNSV
jgi:hypothetical protein